MPWTRNYDPLGNSALSAQVATLPVPVVTLPGQLIAGNPFLLPARRTRPGPASGLGREGHKSLT